MKDLGPRNVLIVDDNRPLAENLSEILEDAGYGVRIAGSCAEALSDKGGFCVALVDVRLPDGDGVSLAQDLKQRQPDSEVILLTGFATLESATAAVRADVWAYLVKPCSPENLLLAVRQAVRHVAQNEEKRQLARRALVAEKLAAVGTMAAGLSHEIRNPLNAASLQLKLLERRVRRLPSEEQPPLSLPLALAQEEILRLQNILEDFLAFARPRDVNLAPTDLLAIAGTVLDLFSEQAAQAGVKLERRFSNARPIDGDAAKLKEAITNLLLNALQATKEGGWIRVEVAEDDGDAVFAIEDSGPGIPLEVRPHLFEPFFTTKEKGSGLGLPLVHAVIAQHAGSISLVEGPGGARFVIRIPLRAS